MNIPKTLDEAVNVLYKELEKDEQFFLEVKEGRKNLNVLHHTTGMQIRNSWGFWSGSELRDSFLDMDIFHADDMSGIILDKLQAKVRGKEFDLNKEIRRYQKHWEKIGVDCKEEVIKLRKREIRL